MKIFPLGVSFFELIFLVTIISSIMYGIFSYTPLIIFTEVWGQAPIEVKIVMNAYNPYNRIFFDPPTQDVPIGSNVNWINYDSSFHTVTSGSYDSGPTIGPNAFDSGLLVTGDSYQRHFDSIGTFPYYCTLHPFMIGKIVVN